MVVVLPKHNLAYFPMRKVASTSVKDALKGACERPEDYQATLGNPMSARQRRLAEGCHKFTIIRDPISRILSCFGNRVVHHKDLSATRFDRWLVRLCGHDPFPDIDVFCQNLRAYRFLNDKIRRHIRPQHISLGDDLGYFDAVYKISDLDELADDLTRRFGKPVTFGHLQAGGPKYKFSDLNPESQAALLLFTKSDYDLLKDFFQPPESDDW